MIWYIFDTEFTLKGIIDEMYSMEINHRFYECDDMTFHLPYTKELYEQLEIGNIIYKGGDPQAFRIQFIEIKEDEDLIWGSCLGLEGILNQRIVEKPVNVLADPRGLMYNLIEKNFLYPSDPSRTVPNLYMLLGDMEGMTEKEYTYYGQSIYEIMRDISKSENLGYKVDFLPKEKKFQFSLFYGVDRTALQSEVTPVTWRSSWGDTRDESFTLDYSNYKNVIYSLSGGESPLEEVIGNSSGWDRFENFIESSEVNENTKDENDVLLTESQKRTLLINKGNAELLKAEPVKNFSFTLNEDIQEIFKKDYNVGDMVSIIHSGYGIIKHARITSIKETIKNDKSQYEINFDE